MLLYAQASVLLLFEKPLFCAFWCSSLEPFQALAKKVISGSGSTLLLLCAVPSSLCPLTAIKSDHLQNTNAIIYVKSRLCLAISLLVQTYIMIIPCDVRCDSHHT